MARLSYQAILIAASLSTALAQCVPPIANKRTVDHVASHESWRPDICNPTVGYGHLCSDEQCSDVKYPIPLSLEDGEKLLREDMAVAEKCITMDTGDNVVLNENQYGALVSWAFNIGCGNSGSSDLIRLLNEGGDPNTVAADELPKWKFSEGEELPGLVRRRKEEVEIFQTPTDVPALPVDC